MTTALRPPFAYYGGKTMLARKIVPLLPAHQHYVEPFAGGLSVLLAKDRAPHETVNDLDGSLVTFWRVLRERPDELAAAIALTPHSRAEHQAAYHLEAVAGDDLETARRVWVLLAQGRGGTMRRTGWRYYGSGSRSSMGMPGYLASYAGRVLPAAERLAGVSLECRDALDVVADYGRHESTLIYADPPYLGSTRSANYRHELTGEDQHRALAEALRGCAAAVVLSGYPSDLYAEIYEGWHRVDLRAWTGNGIRNGGTKVAGDRVECLWSNRPLTIPDLTPAPELTDTLEPVA